MMNTGGDYFEYGEWSDGMQSKLHDQELHEFSSTPDIANVKCYASSYLQSFKHLNTKAYSEVVRGNP